MPATSPRARRKCRESKLARRSAADQNEAALRAPLPAPGGRSVRGGAAPSAVCETAVVKRCARLAVRVLAWRGNDELLGEEELAAGRVANPTRGAHRLKRLSARTLPRHEAQRQVA